MEPLTTTTTLAPTTTVAPIDTTFFGIPDFQIGGYIPFVNLPCERWIGESIWWIIAISTSSPVTCSLIPWLCCPVSFEFNDPFTISSAVPCFNVNAEMGASIYWTIQGISILGLWLALLSLGVCGLREVSEIDVNPNVASRLDAVEGANALLNLTLADAQLTPIPDTVMDIARKAILMEKNASTKKTYNLKKKYLFNKTDSTLAKVRTKRYSGGKFNIPILPQLYTGTDEYLDRCERHEVMHLDGECCEILTQGPCEDDEFVVIDKDTNKGMCVPRLCSPDRVFVFEDQNCHDPFERDICPPGRQLTTSLYGTPVCICPDGTYEEEEDSDDEDVCQPILGKIESCSTGYVFWFNTFKNRPSCLPDPCSGLNSRKGLDEMPYVPSEFDGKCYQVGKELPQCPEETFYTLSFQSLKGICASLEDAGYLVADGDSENFFKQLYGSPLPADISSNIIKPSKPVSKGEKPWRKTHRVIPEQDDDEMPNYDRYTAKSNSAKTTSPKRISGGIASNLPSTKYNDYIKQLLSRNKKSHVKKSTKEPKKVDNDDEDEAEDSKRKRKKRDALPFATPASIFEPSLAACKAGSTRGLNSKCRTRILPSRSPLYRPKRNIRVEPPVPICPRNSFYSIRRRCVSNRGQVQSNLLAFGLG